MNNKLTILFNMKSKYKILFASFLFIFVLFFLFIILNYSNTKMNNNHIFQGQDISSILQYGENLDSSFKILDRYNNIFDINEFAEKPILFLFLNTIDNGVIRTFNDSLEPMLKNYTSRGLNLIYISLDRINKSCFFRSQNNIYVYYETDSLDYYHKFRVLKCCGAIILVDYNHKVILSTLTKLSITNIVDIIDNKAEILFTKK